MKIIVEFTGDSRSWAIIRRQAGFIDRLLGCESSSDAVTKVTSISGRPVWCFASGKRVVDNATLVALDHAENEAAYEARLAIQARPPP
jgi:hypothetical protein